MACILASSYDFSVGCQASIGGVDEVLIMEYSNLDGGSLAITEVADIVTAIDVATGKLFRRYNLAKEMGSDSDNLNRNVATGAFGYDHKVDFTTNGITTAMKIEMRSMAQTPLIVIVKRRDGTYWLYGKTKGMDLVTGTQQNAKEALTGPQQVWGFTGFEPDFAKSVNSGIIAALLVAAS